MIHPVVCNPVLGPLVGVKDPVRWLAGRGYPSGAILHFDANLDPYTEQTGGPHTFNHAVLSPQYQRAFDGSYTDVGAKPAVDTFDGEKWLRSCGAVTNLLPSGAEDLTASSWTKRGTAVVAAGNLVSGIGPGVNDVYILNTDLTADTSLTPSIEIKRVSTTGVLTIKNPSGGEFGGWCVDLSLLSDDYEKITSDHPSVSMVNAFVVPPTGVGGFHFVYQSGVSPLSFYVRNPQLTATSYPVPYTPPGTTQPASNATTTNGSWFSLPDGSELWHALDGGPETDGVELVTNGGFDSDTNGWVGRKGDTLAIESGRCKITLAAEEFAGIESAVGIPTIPGATYVVTVEAYPGTYSGQVLIVVGGIGWDATNTAYGVKTFRFTATSTSHTVGVSPYTTIDAGKTFYVDNISIQRIQPQPLTLATRVRMGVGSEDYPRESWAAILSQYDSISDVVMASSFGVDVGADRIVRASASVKVSIYLNSSWPRNSIIRRITQVSADGTQFRVGYMIEGTHTEIQWSSWVAFDGSFNPSTLYRLMLGYNNPHPMWYNKITAWKEQVSDALIMEAMS